MHSLPSRRRLPQPSFFRWKCYRLAPLPSSHPPPSEPAPPFPGLLPLAHLPLVVSPLASAYQAHTNTHTDTGAPLLGTARHQACQPPPASHSPTHPHTPGTFRQADTRLPAGAVSLQGGRTFSQSAHRDSVMARQSGSHCPHATQSHEDHPHLPHLHSFSHSSLPCGPLVQI